MPKIIVEEQEINSIVKKAVAQAWQHFFNDPEFGLEFKDWVKRRLAKKPEKLVPLKEIKEKYL